MPGTKMLLAPYAVGFPDTFRQIAFQLPDFAQFKGMHVISR
jgi:hypothetical protein